MAEHTATYHPCDTQLSCLFPQPLGTPLVPPSPLVVRLPQIKREHGKEREHEKKRENGKFTFKREKSEII